MLFLRRLVGLVCHLFQCALKTCSKYSNTGLIAGLASPPSRPSVSASQPTFLKRFTTLLLLFLFNKCRSSRISGYNAVNHKIGFYPQFCDVAMSLSDQGTMWRIQCIIVHFNHTMYPLMFAITEDAESFERWDTGHLSQLRSCNKQRVQCYFEFYVSNLDDVWVCEFYGSNALSTALFFDE